jgi:hypothetical protein
LIAHFENRLAYERAMMEESGGTAADKVKPEKGGACQCWASPGHGHGWSIIQKINKVSVTLLDNWGNGGRDFTRTIPFDQLRAVMSKAEVDSKLAAGLVAIIESGNRGAGFGFYLLDAPIPDAKPTPAPEPTKFDAMKDALKVSARRIT